MLFGFDSVILDFLCSGFATGIYTTNNPEACQYVASNAQCNVIVVENDHQLRKILQVWDQLPDLKAVVVYRPFTTPVGNRKVLAVRDQVVLLRH